MKTFSSLSRAPRSPPPRRPSRSYSLAPPSLCAFRPVVCLGTARAHQQHARVHATIRAAGITAHRRRESAKRPSATAHALAGAPVSPSVRASLIARHRSCVHPRTERVVRVASVPRAQNLSLPRRPSRRDRSPSPRTILLAKVSVKTCDELFHALSRARARHVARRASLGDVPTSATDRLEKPSAAGSCS